MTTAVVPFRLVYGVSYFFTEFGQNMTTFVMPSELYPVTMRTTGHGISVGVGKLGAFIGVFLFPCCNPPSACAARCCSPPEYPSSGCCSPWSCPSQPGAAWRRSPPPLSAGASRHWPLRPRPQPRKVAKPRRPFTRHSVIPRWIPVSTFSLRQWA